MPDTRVSLIDLNTPVGDVAAYLNIKTQFSVMDALGASPRLDPVLLDTFMSKAHGVSLLAGTKKFQAGPAPTSASFAKLLRVLSQTFTHTFLDVPASLEPEQMQVITDAGESILVVLTPELPALWRTHRLVLYLSGTGCADRMRLVINRDSKQYELDQKEISRVLNYPIYWRLPNNCRVAIEAINTGKPIIFVNNSGLAKSYYRLAQDLTGVEVAAKKRGLSRFLFGG
jgi:pilus assembly protein CpaE